MKRYGSLVAVRARKHHMHGVCDLHMIIVC
jgi:hypothetical protein